MFLSSQGIECKSWKSRDTWNNRQVWPWSTKWSRANVNRVLSREYTGHSKNLFQQHRNSPGKNTGVGSLFLLQGIFPTQGSNPGLSHRGQILHQLSHKGSPSILEWVVYPFSRGSSWPRNQTGVSCIVGRFFTNWATREALSTLQFTLYL